MSKVKAGEAYVILGARDMITASLARISKRFKAWGSQVNSIGRMVAGSAAVAMAPILGAIASFTSLGDSLNKASARTRIQVSELAKLRFAAKQSGVSVTGLENAIFRMDRRVGNAAAGTGPAVRALKALGIEAKEFSKVSPDKKLEVLMDALNGVENEALRAQLGFELFGDNFRELVPLLSGGSENLEALKKQAEEMGLAFTGIGSEEQAQKAAAFNDSMSRLKEQFFAIAVSVGSSVVPAITAFFDKISPIISMVINWANSNQLLIQQITAVIGVVLAAGVALLGLGGILTLIGGAIGGLVSIVGVAGAALAMMLSPIGLITTGLIAGAGAFLYFSGTGVQAIGWLQSQFKILSDFVGQVIGGISDALAGGDMMLAAEIAWTGIRIAFSNGVNWVLNVWDGMIVGMRNLWTTLISSIAQVLVSIVQSVINFVNSMLKNIDGALKKFNAIFGTNYRLKVRVDFDGQAINKVIADDAKRVKKARTDQLAQTMTARDKKIADLERKLAEQNKQAAKLKEDAELKAATAPTAPGMPEFAGFPTVPTASSLTTQAAVGTASLGINIGGEKSMATQMTDLVNATQEGNETQQNILDELRES